MLITPVERYDANYGMTKPNGKGYTLADVVKAVKTVGERYGVTVADISGLVTDENRYSLLQCDDLHLSSDGYAALAAALKRF